MLLDPDPGLVWGVEPVSRNKRVKCGQEWPVCENCAAVIRVCEGYGVWGGGGKPYGPGGYISATKSNAEMHPLRSLGGRRTAEQYTTFEQLKLKMGIKLSGIFDSEFWDRLVLQASFDEPAILYAVAAIGAAFRSDRLAKDNRESKPGYETQNMDKEGTLALQEYNLAIRCLQEHLRHTDICSLRVTLITCMLFICFEYLRRNLRTGDTHLINGLRLLRDIQTRRSTRSGRFLWMTDPPDSVDDHLVEAFARLNLQCALFGLGSKHIYLPCQNVSFSFKMPTLFSSVGQARRLLDGCMSSMYHLLTQQCESTDQDGHSGAALQYDQRQLKDGLSSWLQAYDETLVLTKPRFGTRLGYMILRMYHTMASIMATVCHSRAHETDFDQYTSAFISIIELTIALAEGAKVIVAQRPSTFNSRRAFTVDMGYIPVLYYTALKCRVPRLRRQAIKLMRESPHREGVWDGILAAAIAKRVVEIEEGEFYAGRDMAIDDKFDAHEAPVMGVDEVDAQPMLPEGSRIHAVNVVLPVEGVAGTMLQCVRRRWMDGEGWRVETREYTIFDRGL